MIGGYYVVGIRKAHILALVAGPVSDWRKAEAALQNASRAAGKRFTVAQGDTYGVAFLAFPVAIAGECNGDLWLQPEFTDYGEIVTK